MNWLGQLTALLSASALSGGICVAPVGGPEPKGDAILTVRVYNYTREPGSLVDNAALLASRILAQVGVRSVWVNCGPTGRPGIVEDACLAKPGPPGILFRLLPKAQRALPGATDASLGYALVPSKGPGYMAGALLDRVSEYVNRLGVPRDAVLGYVMAHEVGHLLLNQREHSRRGIMKTFWTAAEVLRAWSRPLSFNPRQARRMQENLRQWPDSFSTRCDGGHVNRVKVEHGEQLMAK